MENGLADRVQYLGDLEGQVFDYPYERGGETLQQKFTARWCTVPEAGDFKPNVYVPEGVETGEASEIFLDQMMLMESLVPEGTDYEWRGFQITLDYGNESHWGYYAAAADFYETELFGDSEESNSFEYYYCNQIQYQGQEYPVYSTCYLNDRSSSVDVIGTRFFYVPVGYDGIVICMLNFAAVDDTASVVFDQIQDETVMFRLAAPEEP